MDRMNPRGRQLRLAGALAVAGLALSACGGSDVVSSATTPATTKSTPTTAKPAKPTKPKPGTHITGTFTLKDDDIALDWTRCSGAGGYSDFGPGMNVTVHDAKGTIIGTGQARNLTMDDEQSTNSDLKVAAVASSQLGRGQCTLWFDVPLKAKADFYEVSIGRRGDMSYSADELDERDWFLSLTLGD